MDKDYGFHKGAKVALNIVGVLLILLVFTAPIAIWVFWRVSKGNLRVTQSGVRASALFTVAFDFAEVARLGVCRVPVVARGIGGALARYKVGGDHAINVYVLLRNGKKKSITVSMYEDHEAATAQISTALGKPYEPLEMGAFGVKWPAAA